MPSGLVDTPPGTRRRPAGSRSAAQPLPALQPLRSPLQSMGPSLETERRRSQQRRTLLFALLVGIPLLTMLAVGLRLATMPAPVPVTEARPVALSEGRTGAPEPMRLARDERDQLHLQVPIHRSAITAIGYDTMDSSEALLLRPSGTPLDAGRLSRIVRRFLATEPPTGLRYSMLTRGTPNSVQVGALPGADVYAPISGTIVAIAPNLIDDEPHGAAIQIQPPGDLETVVIVRNVDPSEELAVGQTVSEGLTFLGDVVGTAEVLEQPLARYTNDGGDHVSIHVLRVADPMSGF